MFVIGERINGMFREVRDAIQDRDKGRIHEVARRQLAAGADALDINVGPVRGKAVDNMLWLVETVQEATDKPICIDTPKFEVMEQALKACDNPRIINSTKATEAELDRYMPLALETDSQLVALTIDASGVPADADGRVALGATIVSKAMESGLDLSNLYVDPVILPVNVAPKAPVAVMEAIRQLNVVSDPPPNFIIGLSNVSQSCRETSLMNRIYLAMCIAAGLDGAIMDATDRELMEAGITAELMLEKQIYCHDYVQAYMMSK